jgi:hypothetical protein
LYNTRKDGLPDIFISNVANSGEEIVLAVHVERLGQIKLHVKRCVRFWIEGVGRMSTFEVASRHGSGNLISRLEIDASRCVLRG